MIACGGCRANQDWAAQFATTSGSSVSYCDVIVCSTLVGLVRSRRRNELTGRDALDPMRTVRGLRLQRVSLHSKCAVTRRSIRETWCYSQVQFEICVDGTQVGRTCGTRNLWRLAPRDFPSGAKLRLALSIAEEGVGAAPFGWRRHSISHGLRHIFTVMGNTCVVLWA